MGSKGNQVADIVIVGGGLAGCLTALRLSAAKPEATIILIEASKQLGDSETVTFRETESGPDALAWLKPALTRTWAEHTVRFPKTELTLQGDLHAIKVEDLQRAVAEVLGKNLRLNARVNKITDTFAVLENGDVLEGKCILDARGFDALPPAKMNGYLKFQGMHVRFEDAHGLTAPVLVDADCPQLDGFRFFTILPWNEREAFLRENYYSDTSELNHERISRSLSSYAERRGWKIAKIEREESGAFPVPFTAALIHSNGIGEPLAIGKRGGYFHSTTGSVIGDTIRVADFLASLPDLTTANAREALPKFRRSTLARQRFYRLINRMMFFAAEPLMRYQTYCRLFELPKEMSERFYTGRTTWSDRGRYLTSYITGKAPVRMSRAVRSWTEKSILDRHAEQPADQGHP